MRGFSAGLFSFGTPAPCELTVPVSPRPPIRVAGWKSVAPSDQIAATFELLERRLNEASEKRGELSLTVPVACLHARKMIEAIPVDYEAYSP